MTRGLYAELLIEKTAFLHLSQQSLIDQFFQIEFSDLGIAQLHEALNVFETVNTDEGLAHDAANIILQAIGGGVSILYAKAFG